MLSSSILIFICTLTSYTRAQFIKQQHSLIGPFDNTKMNDWFLTGNAKVTPQYIELTTEENLKQGGMWNVHPVKSPDWEVQVQFHIHGSQEQSYGNGIAIWYAKEPLQPGTVFGSRDYYSGLGVFIDTSYNQNNPHKHPHPYISAMVNNGSFQYIHDEDGTNMEIGNCHAELRNQNYITRFAMSYIENTLTVFLDAEGTGMWKQCFTAPGVYLPIGYHLGISASTGHDRSDNHDVISITGMEYNIPKLDTSDRTLIVPHAEYFKPPKEHIRMIPDTIQTEKKDVKKKPSQVKQEKTKREERKPKHEEVMKEKKEDPSLSKSSFWAKCIYVVGTIIIVVIAISTCRKYFERKRISMEKRLY